MPKLESLADLATYDNGVISVLFSRELTKVIEDLHERPGTPAAREVVVKIQVTPVTGESGALEDVMIRAVVPMAKLPPSQTRTMSAGTRGNSALVYNELSPANHRQQTIDQEIERAAKTKGAE